eukprot:3238719-Amphidinium_carterae.1
MQSVDSNATESYSWLWRQERSTSSDYPDPSTTFQPAGRYPTRGLMPAPWRERIASKAMPRREKGKGKGARVGRASGRGRASF